MKPARYNSVVILSLALVGTMAIGSACKKKKPAQWYKGAALSAKVVNDLPPPEFSVELTWPRALYGEVLGYVVERDGEALQQVQEPEFRTRANQNHVYSVYAIELNGHKSQRLQVEVAAPQMRAIGGKGGTIEVLEVPGKSVDTKANELQKKPALLAKRNVVELDVSVERIKTTGDLRKEHIEKVVSKMQSYWRACLRKSPQPIRTGVRIEFKGGRAQKVEAPGIALKSLRECIETSTKKMTLKKGSGSAILSIVSK